MFVFVCSGDDDVGAFAKVWIYVIAAFPIAAGKTSRIIARHFRMPLCKFVGQATVRMGPSNALILEAGGS
jgi:hypothetical protein